LFGQHQDAEVSKSTLGYRVRRSVQPCPTVEQATICALPGDGGRRRR